MGNTSILKSQEPSSFTLLPFAQQFHWEIHLLIIQTAAETSLWASPIRVASLLAHCYLLQICLKGSGAITCGKGRKIHIPNLSRNCFQHETTLLEIKKPNTWNGKHYPRSLIQTGPRKKSTRPSSVAACTGNTPESLGSFRRLLVSMTTSLVSLIGGTGQRLRRHDSNRMHPNASYVLGCFLKRRFWTSQNDWNSLVFFCRDLFLLHSSHQFHSDDLNSEFLKVSC